MTTELVSLFYEASARTLVELDVDEWKYQFNVKNTQTEPVAPVVYLVVNLEYL